MYVYITGILLFCNKTHDTFTIFSLHLSMSALCRQRDIIAVKLQSVYFVM